MSAIADILQLLNQCGLFEWGSRQPLRRTPWHDRHVLFLPRLLPIDFGIVLFVVFENDILRVDLLNVIRQLERLQRDVLVQVRHGCW